MMAERGRREEVRWPNGREQRCHDSTRWVNCGFRFGSGDPAMSQERKLKA